MKLGLRANKSGVIAIGRALGLQCSERERSADLAKRVLEAAQLIKRNHDDMFEERKAQIRKRNLEAGTEALKVLEQMRGINS